MSRSPVHVVGATAGAVGVLVLVLGGLWPARLGGSASYVITSGASMKPSLHAGDLAVVRPVSRYAVGDIAAYRSSQLDAVVLHRIVAVDAGRFTFRGDNNSWLDPEQVSEDQVIGSLHAQLPGAGSWLGRIFAPWTLGPLLGVLAYLGLETKGQGSRAPARRAPKHAAPSRIQIPRDWAAVRLPPRDPVRFG